PGPLDFPPTHATAQGAPFLKLGFLTFRRSGLTATGGRFEYADGLETEPADPTLAFVKRFRIAERLVGPFSYSHVSRSFDGGRGSYDRPAWNVTAMAVRPTHGGFEVSANREIGAVGLAGLALTLKRLPHAPPADVRVFYLYYDDRRRTAKVDNSAGPEMDRGRIAIHSAGAHAATVIDVPAGAVDALLWGVVQAGRWGRLVAVRVEHHGLSLSEVRDRWYSGSGATKDDAFGYTGLPSGGRRELARLVDASIAVDLAKHLSCNTYYGHTFGEGVVRTTFAG